MKKYLICLLVIFCTPLSAFEFDCVYGDIAFTAGFRSDEIKTNVDAFDPPGTLLSTDNLKGKNLRVQLRGVKARLYVLDFFLKGFADFGTNNRGSYTEITSRVHGATFTSKGKVRRGRTVDYSIGLGYLFPCYDYFYFAPMFGVAYDYQNIEMGRITTNGVTDKTLSSLNYSMRWEGPWLGLETQFEVYCFNFIMGYEFHRRSRWLAHWNLDVPDVNRGAFSDKRKSMHTFGNVFYLEGSYPVYGCWEMGLAFKYQYWHAKKGIVRPRNRLLSIAQATGSATQHHRVRKATWSSIELQGTVQYNF